MLIASDSVCICLVETFGFIQFYCEKCRRMKKLTNVRIKSRISCLIALLKAHTEYHTYNIIIIVILHSLLLKLKEESYVWFEHF